MNVKISFCLGIFLRLGLLMTFSKQNPVSSNNNQIIVLATFVCHFIELVAVFLEARSVLLLRSIPLLCMELPMISNLADMRPSAFYSEWKWGPIGEETIIDWLSIALYFGQATWYMVNLLSIWEKENPKEERHCNLDETVV